MDNTANEIREITMAEFFPTIVQMKLEKWRLVQICAVRAGEGYELSYSFAQRYHMVTLRLHLAAGEKVTSITQVYPCAFLQENEMAELFGVPVEHINLDYKDKLYRIDREHPFKEKG